MRRPVKAVLSVPFAVVWIILMAGGCSLLLLPQVVLNAYRRYESPDLIGVWIATMDVVFELFKEL